MDKDTTPMAVARRRLPLAIAAVLAVASASAQGQDRRIESAADLADLSLEELSDIVVTSVSKRSEPIAEAAASVYVITAEDIRRSGVRTLPEALRLAPNLHVARTSGTGWAISARGLNGSNSSGPNKLLVMIDGRSVYNPLFSGVFWDLQDTLLQDVERIEVISGPGGTLWGVNAVNGVINVITRASADTQGALLAAATGNWQSDIGLRHGGTLGASGHYRVFGKYVDRDNGELADGDPINDAGQQTQFGFRMDWEGLRDQFSLVGGAYQASDGQPEPGLISTTEFDPVLGDVESSGANLTARWERHLDGGGALVLQAYYDHFEREAPPNFAQDRDILDIQFLHSLQPHGMHALVWGANFRYSDDSVENSPHVAFLPAEVHQSWSSLFVQDEMALREDLRLILGARAEENDYTGVEFLPNARIAWQIAPDHLLWSAASRTVRAPSRLDVDAFIPGVPPFLLRGGPRVRSEVAKVYEVGYRGRPTERFSYSVTAFHNDYDHLRTQEIDPTQTFIVFDSLMEGRANGIEMWGSWQARPDWRLSGGYTALDEDLWLKPGSNDVAAPLTAGHNPSHTWQLRSAWNIGEASHFDLVLRHVAELPRHEVPDYTTLDLRVGWRPRHDLELALTGRNLLGEHAEYGPIATRIELGPTAFLSVTWEPWR